MREDIARVLFDRSTIARRIEALAKEIIRDFHLPPPGSSHPELAEITLVPILTGSVIFLSDLIRLLPNRMKIRLISVSSYPGSSTVSKGAHLRQDLTTLPDSLEGAHVLVIDDILDSGNTLRLVTGLLREKKPATLKTCVFLRKQRPEAMAFPVDYVAFDVPDEFVVGYGLDYNDYYRNLPEVVTLRPEAIDRERRP